MHRMFRSAFFASVMICCQIFWGTSSTSAQTRGSSREPVAAGVGDVPPQKYYALVIGNNDYQFEPKLKTAVNDAEEVARTLEKEYGFETKLLLNATRSQIMGALNERRRTLNENSSLLIYYAGHGFRDEPNDLSYWLPVDAAIDDTSNWITATDLTSTVKAMAARHVLVVSDSCYSGGMARAALSDQDRNVSLAKLMENTSRNLMASGSLEPVSDSGATGHSVFAEAFLEGLHNATGPVAAGLLFQEYVYRAVLGRGSQTPVYTSLRGAGVDKGDFVFIPRSASAGVAAKHTAAAETLADEKPAAPRAPLHYETPVIDSMTVADALAVLDRAQKMLPKGDMGQIAAVESLVRTHHSLSGMDFSALSLKESQLQNSDFSGASLVVSDLRKVQAGSADFSKGDIAFSLLEDAHLEGADLTAAKLDFAIADRAQFQNAKASGVRGFSISARDADFTAANLRDARFMFGDFTGAKFDRADLTGAFFVGSDLTGASFLGATLHNTDFSGSKLNLKSLSASQKAGACVTAGETFRNVNLVFIDEIPSSKFDGGTEYSRWIETMFGLKVDPSELKSCEPRQLKGSWWYPIFEARGKEIPIDSFNRGFRDTLVQKRGDDIRDRVEERHKWLVNDMSQACLARCAKTGCPCY
jgi:uncharacterized protein YjbI with pentapeptide repeats